MSFEDELKGASLLVSKEALTEYLRFPKLLSPEEFQHVIPSTEMRSDGIILTRLLLIGATVLCDVAVNDGEFDFLPAHVGIHNYRFKLSEHVVKDESGAVVSKFEIAEIDLIHEITGMFGTKMTYAGKQRDEWLKQVQQFFPTKLVAG